MRVDRLSPFSKSRFFRIITQSLGEEEKGEREIEDVELHFKKNLHAYPCPHRSFTGPLFLAPHERRLGDIAENHNSISLSHETEIQMAGIARHMGVCGSSVVKAVQKMESED
jgi:hypothetical protein